MTLNPFKWFRKRQPATVQVAVVPPRPFLGNRKKPAPSTPEKLAARAAAITKARKENGPCN